jgi:hypothetical protein
MDQDLEQRVIVLEEEVRVLKKKVAQLEFYATVR